MLHFIWTNLAKIDFYQFPFSWPHALRLTGTVQDGYPWVQSQRQRVRNPYIYIYKHTNIYLHLFFYSPFLTSLKPYFEQESCGILGEILQNSWKRLLSFFYTFHRFFFFYFNLFYFLLSFYWFISRFTHFNLNIIKLCWIINKFFLFPLNFVGDNCCINPSKAPALLDKEIQSTSTKNMIHLAQSKSLQLLIKSLEKRKKKKHLIEQ